MSNFWDNETKELFITLDDVGGNFNSSCEGEIAKKYMELWDEAKVEEVVNIVVDWWVNSMAPRKYGTGPTDENYFILDLNYPPTAYMPKCNQVEMFKKGLADNVKDQLKYSPEKIQLRADCEIKLLAYKTKIDEHVFPDGCCMSISPDKITISYNTSAYGEDNNGGLVIYEAGQNNSKKRKL